MGMFQYYLGRDNSARSDMHIVVLCATNIKCRGWSPQKKSGMDPGRIRDGSGTDPGRIRDGSGTGKLPGSVPASILLRVSKNGTRPII